MKSAFYFCMAMMMAFMFAVLPFCAPEWGEMDSVQRVVCMYMWFCCLFGSVFLMMCSFEENRKENGQQ